MEKNIFRFQDRTIMQGQYLISLGGYTCKLYNLRESFKDEHRDIKIGAFDLVIAVLLQGVSDCGIGANYTEAVFHKNKAKSEEKSKDRSSTWSKNIAGFLRDGNSLSVEELLVLKNVNSEELIVDEFEKIESEGCLFSNSPKRQELIRHIQIAKENIFRGLTEYLKNEDANNLEIDYTIEQDPKEMAAALRAYYSVEKKSDEEKVIQ